MKGGYGDRGPAPGWMTPSVIAGGPRRIAAIGIAMALAFTGLAILGYALRLPMLYSFRPGFEAMSPLTALSLALIALGDLALLQQTDRTARVTALCACGGASAIGALVLASHLLTGADRLSPVIVAALFGPVLSGGRTAMGTALAIVLLGLAGLPVVRARVRISDGLAGMALIIAGFAVVGYAYGAFNLYSLVPFRTMAINTALTIFLLSCVAILSQHDRGWAATVGAPGEAGRAIRRQLFFTLLPPLIGFVLMRAMAQGLLLPGAAMTLLVVMTIVPLGWLVLREGQALADLERERDLRQDLERAHRETLEEQLRAQAVKLRALNAVALDVAQAATQQSENRYRRLFESIDAAFCIVAMKFGPQGEAVDYRFVEINAAFAANTGLKDAQGHWMRDLAPNHEQHWFDLYGKVASTQIPQRFERPAKELGDRWYDVYAFPIDDPALNRVAILFNDVTERRRSFQTLTGMNVVLEERIKAAVEEVEQANAALRQAQKMEAMGRLTGGVAHDFNNLLTPIMGSLDLLHRRAIGSERERKLIEGALQSAERAKLLVHRLLAFARRQPLQVGPVDVGALVQGMGGLIASTVGPQVRVAVEIDEALPLALADAHQVEMALLNLCVNARDAMPEGGRLTLRAVVDDPASASLSAGDYLRLSVIDTGVGMSAATLERATEPFFSTKGVGKGTGLGLSMVEGLLAQLGGGLTITSAPGDGTRIDLWLPQASAPAETRDDIVPDAPLARRHGRVLVVDDEELVRLSTVGMLEDMGYRIEQAASGQEAASLLRAGEAFDLVVTDHLMPDMTGVDLSRLVRQHSPETQILLVSGYAEKEGIPADLARLTKPFRQAELAQALTDLSR